MLPMKSNSPTSAQDEPLRDRCVAYLLGELDAKETVAFEQRLDDPAVAQLLVQESQLLRNLASPPLWSATTALPPPCPGPTVKPAPSLRAVGVLISAIAATLLIAWMIGRDGRDESSIVAIHPMATRTALQPIGFRWELTRALVEPAIEWSGPPELTESPAWQSDIAFTVVEGPANEDPANEDSATEENVDWMVAAVKVSGLTEGNNDG